MAAKKRKTRKDKREEIRESDIVGLKYFGLLTPLLARLHNDGCERDTAGNRELHFDQYCMLVLLFMFNPVVSSLRAIQQASELKKVQKKLGCSRASLGSLSESSRVFHPELLRGVIEELGQQLQPVARDPRLSEVPHTLTAIDGTLLDALPLLAEAMLLTAALLDRLTHHCEIFAMNGESFRFRESMKTKRTKGSK